MKILFRKPYLFSTILIFFAYLILVVLFSGFYNTIPLIIANAQSVFWSKLIVSLILSLIIGLLVSSNAVLLYIKYKQRRQCKEAGTVATIGTLGGLAAGVCPLCVTGLLPLILGLLGVSFSFASLPFHGIEVQVGSIVILVISLWMLNRR
ncbi:hypothetical protein KW805_04975 [Candidatus Pacearchaeota archaeon]|nr:hypothetical protein [Candidatus Pacearchaeota archaeon]